ncbi:MAG: ATP-binding cassette domain-containing protein [Rhodopseudomonas sp.]|nr:ATP-binding cassette domain-containing protein [Rhodopseudomonas sp.]
MPDIVIAAEGLSKRYMIGHQTAVSERYVALRDVIARKARNVWRKSADLVHGRPIVQGDSVEEFWALRDINLEIRRGEVVGLIGRNGAGKSTLLKILSRITEPTKGRVRLNGRVASLLEVGTGFHPELTGRENIFLNGAILGMSRREIKRKFADIAAFAEIDEFLDTPVKRYSSGMYVRLAFAVAAHLEPEILIVDEVLSVGDAEFQRKCLGKMDAVSKDGRTVLLVSHDMRRLAALCHRTILMNGGMVEADGETQTVIDRYMAKHGMAAFADLSQRRDMSGSGDARFQSIELLKDGQPCRSFAFGDRLVQRFAIDVVRPLGRGLVSTSIATADGIPVYEYFNIDAGCEWTASRGRHVFTVAIDKLNLYPGTYTMTLWIGDRNSFRVDYAEEAISFDVVLAPAIGVEHRTQRNGGLVYQDAAWSIDHRTS